MVKVQLKKPKLTQSFMSCSDDGQYLAAVMWFTKHTMSMVHV